MIGKTISIKITRELCSWWRRERCHLEVFGGAGIAEHERVEERQRNKGDDINASIASIKECAHSQEESS